MWLARKRKLQILTGSDTPSCATLVRYTLKKSVLITLLICTCPLLIAAESATGDDDELLPLARTFLNLHLCADYATQDGKNPAKADEYRQIAWSLYDTIIASGWDEQVFSSSVTDAQEQRSLLEAKGDDTLESFNQRHQSGQACDAAISAARDHMTEKQPPEPRREEIHAPVSVHIGE